MGEKINNGILFMIDEDGEQIEIGAVNEIKMSGDEVDDTDMILDMEDITNGISIEFQVAIDKLSSDELFYATCGIPPHFFRNNWRRMHGIPMIRRRYLD